MYYWSVGLTIKQVRRELGLSMESIGDLYCFLRDIAATAAADHSIPVGGLDENGDSIEVEGDESKFGRIKYNRVS